MSDQQKQIEDLVKRNREAGETIKALQECLRVKTLELDILHYVWCDGGCAGGCHRFTPNTVNEEVVKHAEYMSRRLRRWWNNVEYKKRWNSDPMFRIQEKRRWFWFYLKRRCGILRLRKFITGKPTWEQ